MPFVILQHTAQNMVRCHSGMLVTFRRATVKDDFLFIGNVFGSLQDRAHRLVFQAQLHDSSVPLTRVVGSVCKGPVLQSCSTLASVIGGIVDCLEPGWRDLHALLSRQLPMCTAFIGVAGCIVITKPAASWSACRCIITWAQCIPRVQNAEGRSSEPERQCLGRCHIGRKTAQASARLCGCFRRDFDYTCTC